MLDKETWRKDYWFLFFIIFMLSCLVSIHSEMWIQQQTSCLHQRLIFLAWFWCYGGWVLFVRQIFVSPNSEFEQHMYGTDPRPETVSLMQLESRKVVPQVSQPPSKASATTFNSKTWWPLSENHWRLGIKHIFFIFLFFDSRQGSCQLICGHYYCK